MANQFEYGTSAQTSYAHNPKTMTKQEWIKEGIRTRFVDAYGGGHLGEYFNSEDAAEDLMAYLHSQGAVIKVKCPDCDWSQFSSLGKDEAVGMTPCYRCNSTGYIFEPLIEK